MSETKTTTVTKGNTTLRALDGSPTTGAGASKRFYVGRGASGDFKSFLQFTLDTTFWSGVGKIVSAILTLYTDDGLGINGDFTAATNTPYVVARRLTSAFSEGTNSAIYVAADYTNPNDTATGAVYLHPSAGPLVAVQIDLTDMVERWAPGTVKKRDGTAGNAVPNYGLSLHGDNTFTDRWAAVSEDAESGLNAYKPVLTLTYKYGVTIPNTPTNLTPAGTVSTITAFEGDFSDVDATDQLRFSDVQVYTPEKSGTASTGDVITSAGHGFANGDFIYFTSLTAGTGLSTFLRYCVRDRTASTYKVTAAATSAGAVVDITVAYSALKAAKRIYAVTQAEGEAAILADHFIHTPVNLHLTVNTTYRWRARVQDQEAQWSPWTALTNVSVTNTDPTAPVLTPSGASYASLDAVRFRSGEFSDPDVGDTMLAYQVQLSAYGAADAHWDDDEFILWNTGKKLVTSGATTFDIPYGGASLLAGAYYWRARVWDQHGGTSDWTYAALTLTADFLVDPVDSTNAIQLRPRAPWRIVIRDMFQADGVTPTTGRGPGRVVAVLEDAYNAGASLLYNSPGEAHWTLAVDHPQISVIEPKQTHYAIEFRQGDGWREVFQGLVDDFDATDRDVVFYGKDYLALLDADIDDRYDPANPDKAAEDGGSKYVTTGKNSIGYITRDLLDRAQGVTNSVTGFIHAAQSSATLTALMSETLTIFSTYQPYLSFIASLLDSHRAGTGKRTRLSVQKTSSGTYQWVVTDDPGQVRDNLRMRYGELVQGFRVVAFGPQWSSRVNAIGRDKNGLIVRYTSQTAPGISEAVWGRWATSRFFDGVSDANDFSRKTKQAAVSASKLGHSIGVALREGALQPRDGYDLCDIFPLDIEHGAVSTSAMGSGYWVSVGITWTAPQNGSHNTILTMQPREDTVAPDTDLLTLSPISPQAEWQIGYKPPTQPDMIYIAMDTGLLMDGDSLMDGGHSLNTGRVYVDLSTGYVYELDEDGVTWNLVSGPVSVARPAALIPTTRVTLNDAGVAVANITVRVTA